MAEFRCPVVEIKGFGKHANADSLSITNIEGEPCIFKTGTFQKGDRAVYIPLDAMVPLDHPAFTFLDPEKAGAGKKKRIKAKRLRGLYSEGLLIPIAAILEPIGAMGLEPIEIGTDLGPLLGIEKWVEPIPIHLQGVMRADPGVAPIYDVESWAKYKNVLIPQEPVIITEKLHGVNSRTFYHDGEFFVGTHRTYQKFTPDNLSVYWRAAIKYKLEEKLRGYPDLVIFGEIYGPVQDLRYDIPNNDIAFAVFDLYQKGSETPWQSWARVEDFCKEADLPTVPVIYKGPYSPDLIEKHTEGKSLIANHIREGIVIHLETQRYVLDLGRVILKSVGQIYKLRKNGTELK